MKGRSSCSARPRGPRPPPGSSPPWSKTWSKRHATWRPLRRAPLDPPLALVLDEAANYPLPSLSSLMSEGGGTGVCTTVVLQSLAQARDRWGREAAQAIWDAATVKVVLGGQANADDLADLSRLLGEVEVKEVTESWARGGERTVTSPTGARALGAAHPPLRGRRAAPALCPTGGPRPRALDGEERHQNAASRTRESLHSALHHAAAARGRGA